MITELKELITEGGKAKVFTTYAVEIGDSLWSAMYAYLVKTYPADDCEWCSKYSIDGIYEEAGQKFAVLADRINLKYYRLNFSLTEADGFTVGEGLVEVTKTYTPAAEPQFAQADVDAYAAEYAKKKDEEEKKSDKTGEDDNKKSEEDVEDEKNDEGKKDEEDTDDDEDEEKKKKQKKFSYDTLEEIPEYVDLQTNFENLNNQVAELNATIERLSNENASLVEFKKTIEHKEKEAKIAEFYMLSEEDKADVIANIDNYSLDDIEAKLSVICFRHKIGFENSDESKKDVTTYNLDAEANDDSSTPAWVKAALNVANTMNN